MTKNLNLGPGPKRPGVRFVPTTGPTEEVYQDIVAWLKELGAGPWKSTTNLGLKDDPVAYWHWMAIDGLYDEDNVYLFLPPDVRTAMHLLMIDTIGYLSKREAIEALAPVYQVHKMSDVDLALAGWSTQYIEAILRSRWTGKDTFSPTR